MGKSLKEGEAGEILPPPKKGEPAARANLVTLGDVRSEMGRVYHSMQRGDYTYDELTKRIWALGKIGAVIRDAELLGIGSQSDADERPVFSGLIITPPPELKMIEGGKQPQPQRIKR